MFSIKAYFGLMCVAGCRGAVLESYRDPTLTYETFLSPAIPLRSGQIANTASDWPSNGNVLDFVKGPVAIRSFQASIVADGDREVGLEEM